tara:strand:- start:756 stop:878 length:123 start_codon:yes stop_codon:yes gene_type:complete
MECNLSEAKLLPLDLQKELTQHSCLDIARAELPRNPFEEA